MKITKWELFYCRLVDAAYIAGGILFLYKLGICNQNNLDKTKGDLG